MIRISRIEKRLVQQNKKHPLSRIFFLAGAAGIEPTLTVLETVVLPLYDAPVALLSCQDPTRESGFFQVRGHKQNIPRFFRSET